MQYQLLPDLTTEEYEALKADIAARGVQVPVEYDEAGNVLDGHHRLRACAELGITDWPSLTRVGLSEDEKREHVLTLNLARRHLSAAQRQELVARLRSEGWPLRKIADTVGVSRMTVSRTPVGVTNVTPERVIGKDGKSYPARRPTVAAGSERDRQKAQTLLETVPAEALDGGWQETADLRKAARAAETVQRREVDRAKAAEIAQSTDRYKLHLCDLRELGDLVPPDSVDAIITDPPYPREFLPLYGDLAQLAARVLKPGGSLLAMAGQSYLPDVLAAMTPHLQYQWTLAYMTPGAHVQVWPRDVLCGWKPVFWFVKGQYAGGRQFDVHTSAGADKDHHHWGQSESGMASLIEAFTRPGDTVLDPFLGGGTTGVVAVRLNRLFIGVDVDEDAMATAAVRLAEGCGA